MRNLYSLLLILMIFLQACQEEDDHCESFFEGTIVKSGTELPVFGAQVIVRTYEIGGFFNGDIYTTVDTLMTDETGYFETSSKEFFNDWVVIVKFVGHEDVVKGYSNKPCRTVMETIELVPLAKVNVNTVDVPELHYDELHIKTLPEIYSIDSLESRAILGPNDSTQLWLLPNTEGDIRYWFLEDGNRSDTIDLPRFAEPNEILEITINM